MSNINIYFNFYSTSRLYRDSISLANYYVTQAVIFIMKNDGIDRSFASANVGFLSLDIAILIISFEVWSKQVI